MMNVSIVDILMDKLTSALAETPFRNLVQNTYDSIRCKYYIRSNSRCQAAALKEGGLCKRHNFPLCPAQLKAGKNRGQSCGRLVKEGEFCSIHSKKPRAEIVEEKKEELDEESPRHRCVSILKTGSNKGQRCSKDAVEGQYCKRHARVEKDGKKTEISQFEELKLETETSQTEISQFEESKLETEISQTEISQFEESKLETEISQFEESKLETEIYQFEESKLETEISQCEEECEELRKCLEELRKVEEKNAKMEPEYTINYLSIPSRIKEFPSVPSGCRAKLPSGRRKGQYCGKPIQKNFTCGIHSNIIINDDIERFLPECKWKKGEFWDDLMNNYDWNSLSTSVKTQGRSEAETERDNDDIIDTSAQLPTVRRKTNLCCYIIPDRRVIQICNEKIYGKGRLCEKHADIVKESGEKFKIPTFNPHCIDPNDYQSYAARHVPEFIAGYYHFSRLGLFAHMTRNGPIVVGKLWNNAYAERLTLCDVKRDLCYRKPDIDDPDLDKDEFGGYPFSSDEAFNKHKKRYQYDNNIEGKEDADTMILRCHNNGLLYKILPQETLMYHYSITNLDDLPGEGFVSFEQMIRDRPKLYIKYWNIWNQHIIRARDWLTFKNKTPQEIWQETGITSWVNWERYENEFMAANGTFHVIVPAPSLEQVCAPSFNPFSYCTKWVRENCPEKLDRPHYPPMYIVYPFPDSYYQTMYKKQMSSELSDIVARNPQLVEHYHYSPKTENCYAFLQWLKFGDPRVFTSTSFDVPSELRAKLGYSKWTERFSTNRRDIE